MTTPQIFAGKTLIMSGGSRGIGLAIALAAGRLGSNVVLLAKTDVPNPHLPGTVHTAAAQIIEAGGDALAVVGDVRDEASVQRAVDAAIEKFGGIDFCVNNASALALQGTEELSVKKFDLMQQIQLRGTFMLTRASLPFLRQAENPHILTLSPPLNMTRRWLGAHPAYTLAKYGMTILALGWAAEYANAGVASNTLWPETIIATSAVQNLLGGEKAMTKARDPKIIGDAAIEILSAPARGLTGNTFIDVDVLHAAGITDLSSYGEAEDLEYDLYVDPPDRSSPAPE